MFYQRGDLPITVKLQRTLQSNQISSLDLPHTCRESTMNKVSIQIICLTLFLLSLHKYCFFVSVTLVSFILKCYPLFCINFFYLKVVFHQIPLNLTCAMGHRALLEHSLVYFIRISRLKFAKFSEYFKNKPQTETLQRIYFYVFKSCKYNKIICFPLISFSKRENQATKQKNLH